MLFVNNKSNKIDISQRNNPHLKKHMLDIKNIMLSVTLFLAFSSIVTGWQCSSVHPVTLCLLLASKITQHVVVGGVQNPKRLSIKHWYLNIWEFHQFTVHR